MSLDDPKMIHIWAIPEPPENEVQDYLDIGWYRVEHLGEPWLRWSFAKGTPQWPGGDEEQRRRQAERGKPRPERPRKLH